jgi:hypothetical protein
MKRKALGEVPPMRAAGAAPKLKAGGPVPKGAPLAQAPTAHVARAPGEHGVGAPPNPRKPRLVKDVHGGILKDLFQMFPDLPRPVRPAARVRLRAGRGRAR